MPPTSTFNTRLRLLPFVYVLMVTGCLPTTRFKGSDHCAAYMGPGDKVLLSSLPYDNWEFHLDDIQNVLSKQNVKVQYAPEKEFDLRAIGVINPLETTSYPLLIEKGITHIMVIREVAGQSGQFMASKTPFELLHEVNAYRSVAVSDDATSAVEIAMHLIRLKDGQDYSFLVTTNVSGVRTQERDGGTTTVNGGGLTKARNVAIRKGVRRLSEICR